MRKEKCLQQENNVVNGTDSESIDYQDCEQSVNNDMESEVSFEVTCSGVSMCVDYTLDADHNENDYASRKGLVDRNNVECDMPEGRRIVDITYMWNEIHRIFDDHARGIECQFKDWKLINSRRRGLLTQLFFKCQMCHYEDNIWSEAVESKELNGNTATVVGTVTAGIGFYQLEELCAANNIPCMTEKTYIKHREKLVDDFRKTAMESMKEAAEIEKQLAMEKNETINGIPYITVVADGSWMKRSYGNAYDSLSGFRTGKVLFVGIRNKYCAICDAAGRQNVETRKHKCYKNFDRNASSTSMESDAIVEGFTNSVEMHGLIYKTIYKSCCRWR